MRQGVCRVHKLSGNETAGNLPGKFLRPVNSTRHAFCAFGKHQLRTIGFHQLAAFNAHGFRHDDDNSITAGSGYTGKSDAGIARGRLNDDRTGLQQPFLLCIVDHRLCNTVLGRSRRVQILQLRQNPGFQVFQLFYAGQFQQRGFSNQLIDRSINLAHDRSSKHKK